MRTRVCTVLINLPLLQIAAGLFGKAGITICKEVEVTHLPL